MRGKWNDNICCGTADRPPLSERIQLGFSGDSSGESFKFSETAVWWFLSGWGRRLKKDRHFSEHQIVKTIGSLLETTFIGIFFQLNWITCAEPPVHYAAFTPTNLAKPAFIQTTWLHSRKPEPGFTTASAAKVPNMCMACVCLHVKPPEHHMLHVRWREGIREVSLKQEAKKWEHLKTPCLKFQTYKRHEACTVTRHTRWPTGITAPENGRYPPQTAIFPGF